MKRSGLFLVQYLIWPARGSAHRLSLWRPRVHAMSGGSQRSGLPLGVLTMVPRLGIGMLAWHSPFKMENRQWIPHRGFSLGNFFSLLEKSSLVRRFFFFPSPHLYAGSQIPLKALSPGTEQLLAMNIIYL